MKKSVEIPFDFILDQLFTLEPRVRPMFGCQAVYVGEKIMLILRNKPGVHEEDNGVWISTRAEHHEGLKKLFPSMRSIQVLGNGATNWQIIPVEADDFEESATKVCDLILKGDSRIGNIPKPKKPKGVKRMPAAKKVKTKREKVSKKSAKAKGVRKR
jgi:hypothetical protein